MLRTFCVKFVIKNKPRLAAPISRGGFRSAPLPIAVRLAVVLALPFWRVSTIFCGYTIFYIQFMLTARGDFVVSYAPLWATMKERNVSAYALVKKYNMSDYTLTRMRRGEHVSTRTLEDLCQILDCTVQDVVFIGKNEG